MNPTLRRVRAVFLITALGTVSFAQPRAFTNQYSFGDSLSDSGNLFAATGALGAANPPAPYYQGRFSNGPTFVESLGNPLALAVTSPASVKSSLNFAFGGATAGGSSSLPPTLSGQIALFRQRAITPARTDLFTVLAGANDLIAVLGAATTPTNPAALDVAGAGTAQTVATQVQALIGLGARNLVVAGLPNLGATPRSLAAGGPGGAGATFGLRATNAFNHELRARLQAIASASAEVNLVYVDIQGMLDRILNDPASLGYSHPTSYFLAPAAQGGGVGDPNDYVFWDEIHPTARTHALLANIITEQLNPEIPLGFASTLGTASLALQGLSVAALDDRTRQLAFSGRTTGRADAFASFHYGDGGRDRDGGRLGFDYTAQVVTGGVDLRISDGVLLGGALHLGRLNAQVNARGGDFTVEDAAGRIYAAWRGGPVSLLLDAGYGTLAMKGIHRTTAFGGLATTGKTGGDHWGAGLKAMWTLDLGGHSVRPWFGLRTDRVRLDAYTERDVPALAMDFASQKARSSAGAVGVDGAWPTQVAGRSLRLDLRGAWHGELGSSSRDVAGKLAENFTRATSLAVDDGDGSGFELGGALTLFLRKNWSASLGYTGDIRGGDQVTHRGSLAVQTGF